MVQLQSAFDELLHAQTELDRTIVHAMADGVITQEEGVAIRRRQSVARRLRERVNAKLEIQATTISLVRTMLHTGELTAKVTRMVKETREDQIRLQAVAYDEPEAAD